MKNKKNGFTLVELLAVIVVLAIIMLIAIPAIVNVVNRSKKEAFYLYAENIQGKALQYYLQTVDEQAIKNDCEVYDINDLNLKNVGDYEGWAQIKRTAAKSEDKGIKYASVRVPIDKTKDTSFQRLEYAFSCVTTNSSCTPTESYGLPDNVANEHDVTIPLNKPNQTACVGYSYFDGQKVKKSSNVKCISYKDAQSVNNFDYNYNVIITLKDNAYKIENFEFEQTGDKKTKNKFYDKMVAFKKGEGVITGPTCNGGPAPTKGSEKTTEPANCANETSFNITLNPTGGKVLVNDSLRETVTFKSTDDIAINSPTKDNYIFLGWFYSKQFESNDQFTGNSAADVKKIENGKNADGCKTYKDITLYAKWTVDNSKTTTTAGIHQEQVTTEATNERGEEIVTTEEVQTKETQTVTVTTDAEKGTESVHTTETVQIKDMSILLNTLNVANYPIDFSPVKFSYDITIPYDVDSLNISYEAYDKNSRVEVFGNENFRVGDNLITVAVTNPTTGEQGIYKISVRKLGLGEEPKTTERPQNADEWDPESGLPDPKIESSNASLNSIHLNGIETIKIEPNKYDYVVKIPKVKEVSVIYYTASPNATVIVNGDKNVKDGGVITLDVVSENGYYNKKYTIKTVYKEEEKKNKTYRNILIALSVILLVLLAIASANKRNKLRIVNNRKTTDNNVNNNVNNTQNDVK